MDTKSAKLIGNIAKFAIAIPGVIMIFLILQNGNEGIIDAAIKLTLVALVACAAVAIIFGIIYFLGNITKSKGVLFGIVGFALVLAISYSMASGEVLPEWAALDEPITERVSKLSGMGVYSVLILLAVAVGAAVFSEVSKLIKG